jgi:hypothetical protein
MLEDSATIHTVSLPKSCLSDEAVDLMTACSRVVADKFNIIRTKYAVMIRRKQTTPRSRVSATLWRKGFKPVTTLLHPAQTLGSVRTLAACSLDLDVKKVVLVRADTLAPLCSRKSPRERFCDTISSVFGDSRCAFVVLLEGEELPTRKRKNQEEEESASSSQPQSKRQRTEEEEVPVVAQPEL